MSDTILIARRPLYRGRELAYRVGDAVPADAYPTHQINTLLANGGLARVRATEAPPAATPELWVPELEADPHFEDVSDEDDGE